MSTASFDSNILIDTLNGIEAARNELLAAERRLLSRVAWIEVMTGVTPATEAAARRVLDLMTLIELDERIALRAGAARRERRRLKLPDAIIWATAQIYGCLLITRNTKDFPPGTPGVRIPYILQD